MNEQQSQAFFNAINLLAFALGWENLQENRAQSQYNDVHAANDKQAEFLLGEIRKMIDEQNVILETQNEMLERMLKEMSEYKNGKC